MEDPVHAILVVCGCEYVGNDEFAPSSDDDRVVAEIGMFEEDARIFFVNADSVLDSCALASSVDKCSLAKTC